MGLGYLATGLLLVLPFVTTRFWFLAGGNATGVPAVLAAHRFVTYLGGFMLVVHVVGLILIDSMVVEYLKPSAPWGMVAALLATAAFFLLIMQSEFRIKLNMRYNRWRSWHVWLSVLLVFGTSFHIYEAKYFTQSISETIVLGALTIASGVSVFVYKRKYQPLRNDAQSNTTNCIRLVVYAALICSVVLFILSIPSQGNRTERQALQCLIDVC